MAVIAVTGSGGFIGRHLCDLASRTGIELRTIPRGAFGESGLPSLLSGVDAVVHLAAKAHDRQAREDDPDGAFEADNVVVTRRIGDACKAAGVRRLVFVSSAGVLGASSPPEGFTDASPPAPHDAYTRSKLAAETLLRNGYADCLDTVIIRPPLVYGPGAKGSFARLMDLATTDWPLPLGAMTAPRSLISVRNLCDLLLRVTQAPSAGGLCLLVADAETTSIAELARSIRAAVGRPSRVFSIPPAMLSTALRLAGRGGDVPRLVEPFVVRASSALAMLGWAPPHRLQDEILWTGGCGRSGSGAL